MGRLSAETEERMINIENNITVVMLEEELEEGGERSGKCTSSKIIEPSQTCLLPSST